MRRSEFECLLTFSSSIFWVSHIVARFMTNPSPHYQEFAPPNAIADLIDAFWCFLTPCTALPNACLRHRVLPDGCMDLIFRCQRSTDGEMYNPQLTIYGATDRFNLFEIRPATEFVGVRFSPGMAGLFLKVNPIDLFQQEVKPQDCSEAFVNIFDRLCECSSTEQVLSSLQASLLVLRAVREGISLPIRAALRLVSTSKGRMPVSQIAKVVGVSERTLRRGVTKTVGLSPKVLGRILRFQSAMTRVRSQQTADLCRIALECGYVDQSHMGREFQQFSGSTPTTFIP